MNIFRPSREGAAVVAELTTPCPFPSAVNLLASNSKRSCNNMSYQEWLTLYAGFIGSDGDDGDGGDGDGDGDSGDASGDGDGQADGDGDGDGDGNADGDGDGNGDDDDDTDVSISAKELENMRQENARLKREDRKRQKDAKAAKEKQQREEGRHEEIAKEREEERDAEKAKAEAAETELDQTRRDIRTRDAASKLNFREPEDAIRFLTSDDTETEESVTKALEKLAKKKVYLLNDRPRTGRAGNGQGTGSGGLTMEEIRGMSTAEVAERMPEVKKALAAQRPKAGGRT